MGRFKSSKKHLSVYRSEFSFRPPYQILLDETVLREAVSMPREFSAVAEALLGDKVRVMTTRCALASLERQLDDESKSKVMRRAEAIELRRCVHVRTKSAAEQSLNCLADIVGKSNEHHYMIATGNALLKKKLYKIPGVPTLHLYRGVLTMEAPSPATKQVVVQLEKSKYAPKSFETSMLSAHKTDEPTRRRKKKAKGPNPLSCKKKARR